MVLVIIGIAAGIVVPMLGNTGDIDASAAARRLTSDLLYAQNYAITHQTRVRVTFNTGAAQYTLAEVPGEGLPTTLTHPVTRRPYVVAFSVAEGLEQVQLAEANFSGQAVVEFDSLGAPSGGGSVRLSSDGANRTVSVAPVTGKVSVE